MSETTININNAKLAQEIGQAKNYAIKSNNISNDVRMDLNNLKSELYQNTININNLTEKIENLCNLLSEKNNDPSYNYSQI